MTRTSQKWSGRAVLFWSFLVKNGPQLLRKPYQTWHLLAKYPVVGAEIALDRIRVHRVPFFDFETEMASRESFLALVRSFSSTSKLEKKRKQVLVSPYRSPPRVNRAFSFFLFFFFLSHHCWYRHEKGLDGKRVYMYNKKKRASGGLVISGARSTTPEHPRAGDRPKPLRFAAKESAEPEAGKRVGFGVVGPPRNSAVDDWLISRRLDWV